MSDRFSDRRDGFELVKDDYQFPKNFVRLTAEGKRATAICHMYVNGGFTVGMIMRMLDEDYGNIVKTLLAHRVIKDRRIVYGKSPSHQERRSLAPPWLTNQNTDADPSGEGM
jgi:hypothetical protein